MLRSFRAGLIAATCFAATTSVASAYDLTIMHINDFHSRIEAINKYDSTCSPEEATKNECLGGIARMKTAIDARRAALNGSNVLVLDAGDQSQGSLFYTTYKTQAIAEFMNGIGFDAMAVGNHEFDDGPQELMKFLDAAKFPIISGNTVAKSGSPLAGRIPGFMIKDVGGQKIGIVSVLATDTNETSSPGPDITFRDEIDYLKQAVQDITAQGVNKIVLLSHVGYHRDQEIAAAVDGIDVIVGGHSHTLLSSTDPKAAGPYPTLVKNPAGVDVPIVTAYAYSKYLGDLTVTFDDTGKVTAAKGAPQLLDSAVQPDAGFTARVAELAKPLEAMRQKEVSESSAVIDGARETCRVRECSMGNLVADAMLDRVKSQGVTIALQNGGGVRASIDAGMVTMGEVLTVLPFQNSIATFQLTGRDLIAALENGVSDLENGAGRFLQVSGMRYSYDGSRPKGSRVLSTEAKSDSGFTPIKPDTLYSIVSNDYVRRGGDGFSVFAEKAQNAYDFGPSLEDTVAAYLTAHRPYTPVVEGRITVASGTTAAAKATPTSHTIQRGDTLWDIAETAYGDGAEWKAIARENPKLRPRKLEIGQTITLPQQR
ncbi:5'-nucleotidase C-terminal domain-containing protein [Rhizobium sp. CFBP 8762]|uniref:bifunctional metallophosphatase/5'-nucleotidase n=1 Tax=Rhizobium sp. CFBP 8762 TaxID=2775279 RepID=UPI00177D866E|nr:bifunctional metallophosphatase/5'-nucleotidase [Rhizobium sp. CFBP 8762]MBD8556228.1 5'-nucleotidase C-terminal domain-containing protein [Rhizobium sp. CFBP 8762]